MSELVQNTAKAFNVRFGLVGDGEKLKGASVSQLLRKGRTEEDLKKMLRIVDSIDLVHGCLGATPTFEHLSRAMDGNLRLYMGHGLVKRTNVLTHGEPLDAVISVAVLANLERACAELGLDLPKSTILVADNHAAVALNVVGDADIAETALKKLNYLKAVSRLLGTKKLEIALASDIHNGAEYQSIKERVVKSLSLVSGKPIIFQDGVVRSSVQENSYTLLELTDILWFNEIRKVNVKLGWTDTPHEGGEKVFFDSKFRKYGLDDPNRPKVGFMYHIPGMDLRSGEPVPPYIARGNEGRILLDLHTREDVKKSIAESTADGLMHVQRLAASVGRLLGKEPDGANLGDWVFEQIVLPVRGYL